MMRRYLLLNRCDNGMSIHNDRCYDDATTADVASAVIVDFMPHVNLQCE